jgi:hypothetical protein
LPKNNQMKKLLFFLILNSIIFTAKSQNGLEGIIVEKYYVSDVNDQAANSIGGNLPVGSVTYRIFVDMLPGYRFQAAYGVPGHELRIETSTLFFNNEDYGNLYPTFSKNNSRKNTVMLDSWVSVGAACNGYFGVLKTEDDGVNTNVNNFSPQVLQNNNATAGIPISQQDGLIVGTPKAVTAVGISTELQVFNNQNDGTNGPVFSTTNGSWASLTGSIGQDSLVNKVLIAQITTNGNLTFQLNIQIGTPTGGVQNYVAVNPINNEILESSLSFDSSSLTNFFNTNDKNSTVRISPNPTKDFLQIELNNTKSQQQNMYLNIIDLEGRLILKNELSSKSTSIDLRNLSKGFYFVELNIDGNTTTKKFIKE